MLITALHRRAHSSAASGPAILVDYDGQDYDVEPTNNGSFSANFSKTYTGLTSFDAWPDADGGGDYGTRSAGVVGRYYYTGAFGRCGFYGDSPDTSGDFTVIVDLRYNNYLSATNAVTALRFFYDSSATLLDEGFYLYCGNTYNRYRVYCREGGVNYSIIDTNGSNPTDNVPIRIVLYYVASTKTFGVKLAEDIYDTPDFWTSTNTRVLSATPTWGDVFGLGPQGDTYRTAGIFQLAWYERLLSDTEMQVIDLV